jgi:DNA-binding Xre family transcriptional regulator
MFGGETMRADNRKLDLILARQCRALSELRSKGLSSRTLTTIQRGEDVRPATLGRLARILDVDVSEIIKKED